MSHLSRISLESSQCRECGKFFCLFCITKLFNRSDANFPLCRKLFLYKNESRITNLIFMDIKLKCPNENPKYFNYIKHLNECKF